MELLNTHFPAMASRCDVNVVTDNTASALAAIEQAAAEVKRIEQKYSRYRPDSLITQINQAAGSGRRTFIDTETAWLLRYANDLYQDSEGLFDITSGKLSRAWDFRNPIIPSAEQLADIRKLVGWSMVEVSEQHIYLPLSGMEIDVGGFGKEYALDRAADILIAAGFVHGYLNFGGDIRVLGPQPDGAPWQVGIRNPNSTEGFVASIPMRGGGLATSGDYERFFEIDGQRFTHIIHPKTGMPVNHWRSVSVIADTALHAGSCSTIGMLMANPQAFFEQLPLRYLMISPNGALITD